MVKNQFCCISATQNRFIWIAIYRINHKDKLRNNFSHTLQCPAYHYGMTSLTFTHYLHWRRTEFLRGASNVASIFTHNSYTTHAWDEATRVARTSQDLPPSLLLEPAGNRSTLIFRLNPFGTTPGSGFLTSKNFTSATFIAIITRMRKTYENLPRLNLAFSCPGVSVPKSRSSRVFEIWPKLSPLRSFSAFKEAVARTANSCSTCAADFALHALSWVCICSDLKSRGKTTQWVCSRTQISKILSSKRIIR